MAGRILPPLSLILPFWLVRSMVGWRETWQVWPALLVSGATFAGMQFYWSNYQEPGLVDIVAAGRPVVATRFPHAVELLATGAGLVVPQRDDVAMASAMERLLTRPVELAAAAEEARRVGQRHAWPRVAAAYEGLARLVVMSDKTSVA